MQIVPEADPENEGTQLGRFAYLKGSKEHLEAGFSPSSEASTNEKPCHKKILNNSRLMIRNMLIVELHSVDKHDRCKFRTQTAWVEANVLLIHRHPRLQDLLNPQWDLSNRTPNKDELELGIRRDWQLKLHLYC